MAPIKANLGLSMIYSNAQMELSSRLNSQMVTLLEFGMIKLLLSRLTSFGSGRTSKWYFVITQRIINKSFLVKYYNQKCVIQDVTSRGICIVKMLKDSTVVDSNAILFRR